MLKYFTSLTASSSVSGGSLNLSVTVSPADGSGTQSMSIAVPVDSADLAVDIRQAVAEGLAANFSIPGVVSSQIVLLGA